MYENIRVWRLWAPRWPWARVPCTLCTPYCYATVAIKNKIIPTLKSHNVYYIHAFGRAAWALGSGQSQVWLSEHLTSLSLRLWATRALRFTDFLLKSTRLLTPQVPQQQRWRIACILVVKRAFQHMTLREIPIPKSRDLVLHNPGISGLKNGPGSRDCNPYQI